MTYAPNHEPLAFGSIDDVARAIRARGGRYSTPMRLMLETLFAADGPIAADDIARGPARLDVAGVYRILRSLEELGVVRHVHLAHGAALYALTSAFSVDYLVCDRCDRVTSVPPESLAAVRTQIELTFGYTAPFRHFAITGLCPPCSTERQNSDLAAALRSPTSARPNTADQQNTTSQPNQR